MRRRPARRSSLLGALGGSTRASAASTTLILPAPDRDRAARCGTTARCCGRTSRSPPQEVGARARSSRSCSASLLAVALHLSAHAAPRASTRCSSARRRCRSSIIAPLLVVVVRLRARRRSSRSSRSSASSRSSSPRSTRCARVDPDAAQALRTLDATRWQALPLRRGARRAARRAQRREDRRRRRRHRRRVRRVGGLGARASATCMLQAIPQLETARAYAAVVLLAAFAVAPLRRPRPGRAPPRPLGPSPTGRTRPLTRRLVARRCSPSPPLLLAACGEKRGADRRAARSSSRAAHARLLPQRRPRRASTRRRPTATSAAPGSTSRSRRRRDPAAPLKLLRRGQGRPRDLLRARAAARARQGPAARRRRRARAEAADVRSSRSASTRSPTQGPGRQDRRHGRHPLPVGLPEDDPRQRRRRPVVGQGDQRRLQPRPRDAVEEGRRDARRVLELRGRPAAPARSSTRRSSGWRTSACRPTTSSSSSPASRTSPRAASGCAASCARSARATRRCARTPRPASTRCCKANPDLDRGPAARGVKATLPVFFPAAGKPFGWLDSAEWARYGDWMYANKLLSRPPNAARALTNEFLPGQGLADAGTG